MQKGSIETQGMLFFRHHLRVDNRLLLVDMLRERERDREIERERERQKDRSGGQLELMFVES